MQSKLFDQVKEILGNYNFCGGLAKVQDSHSVKIIRPDSRPKFLYALYIRPSINSNNFYCSYYASPIGVAENYIFEDPEALVEFLLEKGFVGFWKQGTKL